LSQSDNGLIGVISFAIGGALLLFGIYYILENVDKSWIDKGLFMSFFVLPIGLIAFFLLGLGLFMIAKSARSRNIPPPHA